MAATSKTDIINLALGHLKQRAVTAIDPPVQTSAKIAVKYYDDAILSMLRILRPWWAKKQVNLSASPDVPLNRFSSKFPLPNDFVAILTIGSTAVEQFEAEYDLMEDGLYIDEEGPLPIEYIFQQFDVNKFDSLAKMCASYTLAELMAYELTGNANLRQLMSEKVAEFELKQRSITGQERPTVRYQRSKFAAARRRSSSRNQI